jgi:hypothetical protein
VVRKRGDERGYNYDRNGKISAVHVFVDQADSIIKGAMKGFL